MRQLSALTLLLTCVPLVRAQGDAKAIITRAVQMAGIPTDNKAYHETWKEAGKITAAIPAGPGRPAQDITLTYESNWAFEAPDKYRFDMKGDYALKVPIPGLPQSKKVELAFIQNGKRAVETAQGRREELKGAKLEESLHSAYQFWVCSLRPLLNDPGFTLTALGDREFGGKSVTSVKVTRPGNRDVTLHFDKTTGLLAGSSDRVKDEFQDWKEVAQETEYTDYEKSASGERFFKAMTVKREGKVMLQSKLSDYKRSETLQPQLFKLD